VPAHTITTARLVLRPPVREDAQAIYDGYARDPDVARYVIWVPHRSLADTQEFLNHFIRHGEEERSYPWVMIRAEDDVLIGAMHLRVDAPRAEFGYNIAQRHWNEGYGTEAVEGVIAFAFSLPHVERVQAVCHVDNLASARVMEKAGMRREGRLERYLFFPNLGDEAQDVFLYAVTRPAGVSDSG
jgi:RimJ/RimL family protein N-acetyltransferase